VCSSPVRKFATHDEDYLLGAYALEFLISSLILHAARSQLGGRYATTTRDWKACLLGNNTKCSTALEVEKGTLSRVAAGFDGLEKHEKKITFFTY